MISVGIRELKSHLSQYIDLVKKGENVLITEHNKVVAVLKIPDLNSYSDDKIKETFDKLIQEGSLVPAKRKTSIVNKSTNQSKKRGLPDWWRIYQESKND
ncbi:type II toxin-antitoxin system Phd/YefM family antitoxin [Leptospira weilii]|uniref:type II toxin-antitoxin system Phd/YefM family antitoxin n=1 Tax=Leptospira weilii TaxID=28184 RepID=UPI000569D16D|nr:type II toxin-antitoxin system prevent-host-death family antitoxin [Leptospira weilii]